MKNQIVKFIYQNHEVDFELGNINLLVIATEMAKIFGKQVIAFSRNDDTKNFISECLKSENSHFLGIEKEEDLIISKQKSGTWMHRILALKFAAWLSPAFEIWVYKTIDNLLNGFYKKQREYLIARERAKKQIKAKRDELLESNPEMKEYFDLEDAINEANRKRAKVLKEELKEIQLNINF